uniref:NEDD4-binding protein 2 n=1 Tax=Anthurium amnicola TaxID=1678845 RepID=A0A1D1XF32_9ARAE
MKPPKAKKNRKRKKKGAASASPPQGDDAAGAGDPPERKENEETGAAAAAGGGEEDEEGALNWLVDAFSSYSLEQVQSAYREAHGDPYMAAEILGDSSAGSTTSGSPRGAPATGRKIGGNRKQKKVAVSTGLVSDVIGKGYWGSVSRGGGRRSDCTGPKERWNESYTHEEAEEFLCSMLGGSCELDPAVVKDVFGHCGYDVVKTLDTLLDMSASSNRPRESSCHNYDNLNYVMSCPEEFVNGLHKDNLNRFQLMDRTSDSTYYPFVKEHKLLYDHRDNAEVYLCSDDHTLSKPGTRKLDLQQKVLESLFNMPNISEQEPSYMNWKKALKKVESFSQGLEFCSTSITEPLPKLTNGKDDSYEVFRTVASCHWETMKSYYQKAAVAYSKGEGAHAGYLSEKGKFYRKLAREADEKASHEIFEARNKDIRNAVTIDLHGQHVKQAIKLLKLHLLLFTYIPSIQFLRVITGCGTHGVGRGKVKQSVIDLVEKEGIEWSEDNPGTVVLRIDGLKEYSFMTSDNDSE